MITFVFFKKLHKYRNMRIKASLLIVTVLFCNFLQAQNSQPTNIFKTTLSNGLQILVIEDKSVPLATIELCVKNGAYTETPEYDGLSHLYEHMFFKANKDYPNQEAFMDKIQEMGAIFNGTTSEERVNYFITVTNNNLEEGLKFLNTAMRYPLFQKEEMAKENPVVDGEFQRAESNPSFVLSNDMDHQLWGDLYSRKNVIGDHDIINTATPEKMQIIKEKFYVPNNTLLAVAGDVDHEEIYKLAEAIYGDWERSSFEPFVKYPIPEFKPLEYSSQFVTVNENAQVPVIMMAYHGPDMRNDIEATYAADVFSFILSQNSSKFHQEMVETGLTQGISVNYHTLRYIGPISIFLVLKDPQKLDEALNKLYEHIDQWDSDDYFTDEQIQTAKDLLAVSDAYNRERSSSFIHTLTFWWASADIDYYLNYIDKLQDVTREDIKRYVRQYIKGKVFCSGLLINPMLEKEFSSRDVFTDTKKPEEYFIDFEINSATLTESGIQELASLVQWLKINPGVTITINVNAGTSEVKKIKLSAEDIAHYPNISELGKKTTLQDARYISIKSKLAEAGISANRANGKFQRINNITDVVKNTRTTFSILKK